MTGPSPPRDGLGAAPGDGRHVRGGAGPARGSARDCGSSRFNEAAGPARPAEDSTAPGAPNVDALPPVPVQPAGPMSLYQWRRSWGDCTVCGAPADGRARCEGCAAELARRRARNTAALAALREAAAEGRGLTAAEVRVLTGRRRRR